MFRVLCSVFWINLYLPSVENFLVLSFVDNMFCKEVDMDTITIV